jgi:hypothetical protein
VRGKYRLIRGRMPDRQGEALKEKPAQRIARIVIGLL